MPLLPHHPRNPRSHPGWLRVGAALGGAVLFGFGAEPPTTVPEGTIAWWRFDEIRAAADGPWLVEEGPGQFHVPLPSQARLVPGRRGRALRVGAPAGENMAKRPESASTPAQATGAKPPMPRNPTDSSLNLGGGAWTVEAWLQLDERATEEGVLLEIGTGPRGHDDLVTRLSLLPRENAVVVSGLAPVEDDGTGAVARRVEFPDPGGPPSGTALLINVTLVADFPLPRARWFHTAVVRSLAGEMRLFVDGVPCAVARTGFRPLPRGNQAYLMLGSNALGGRPFPGLIDELRVSDHAVYSTRFAPARDADADAPP